MSYEEKLGMISLPAASDQSANIYRFVIMTANGFTLNTVAGGACVGVLQTNDANAVGRRGNIGVVGVSKVAAGAAVAVGANIQSDATGRAIAAAAGDFSQGIALEAATAAGQVIAVLVRPQGQLNP